MSISSLTQRCVGYGVVAVEPQQISADITLLVQQESNVSADLGDIAYGQILIASTCVEL